MDNQGQGLRDGFPISRLHAFLENVKGTVGSAVVTGRRYFALTKAEE